MSVVCTGRLLGARAPPPPPPPPPAADALLPGRRSLLSPTDLAAVACTHRAWRKAVDGEEPLWRALCEAEFCLAAPVGPDRQPRPGYKAAYAAWRTSFGQYGPLATRALRAWRKVEEWTAQHFPEVAASLRCERRGMVQVHSRCSHQSPTGPGRDTLTRPTASSSWI